MRRRSFIYVFVIMFSLMLSAPDRSAAACEPDVRSLRLRLLNEARADTETLDHARREAEQIWATGGVRLVWQATDDVDVYVIVRDTLVRSDARAASAAGASRPSNSRQVMGRVLIDESGQPTRLIHVSLDAIGFSVAKGQERTWPGRPLPLLVQRHVVGRALGRVIAHEIGHWLGGRGHAREGLMKPILYPRDLVAPDPPALPAAWRLTLHAVPAVASPNRVASEAPRCVR